MVMFTHGRFDEGKFDSARFDCQYRYIATLIDSYEDERLAEYGNDVKTVSLTKVTETTDSFGITTTASETSDDIIMAIDYNVTHIRELFGRGIVKEGSAVGFFKRKYPDLTNNGTSTVEVGDKITLMDETVYRVEEIKKYEVGEGEIMRQGLLIKQDT